MIRKNKNLYRIIDANFNRAKEGLRVCEDTCRFVLDCKTQTRNIKMLRHDVTNIVCRLGLEDIIDSREIQKDVGKKTTLSESRRKKIEEVFYANSQRVKESIRVLEEFSKLLSQEIAEDLKKVRYRFYAIEKKVIKAL